MPEGRKKVEKKRLLLRIDPALHDDLRLWAEDDFRSTTHKLNSLKQAVAKRKREDR